MSIHIPQASIAIVSVLGVALAVGCGGIDDAWSQTKIPDKTGDDSAAQTAGLEEISVRIQEPTGTVDATTVGPVAEEFASVSSTSLGGSRAYAQQTQTAEQTCEGGGNMTASGTASASGGDMSVVYDSCCYAEGCCYDGTAYVIYSDAGGGSYNYCADYDVDGVCDGQNLSVTYATCMQTDGSLAYSVEISGETYTVTGYFGEGNGELTITGANGSWTCTYASGSGSCTGTGGYFTF